MPKIRQNINPYQGSIEAIIRPNWDGDDGEMHNIFHVDAEDTTCVLHLKFDEGSGSTAYDSSIYGNDGTVHGATWSSGVIGSGIYSSSYGKYVDIPVGSNMQISNNLSVFLWAKISNLNQHIYMLKVGGGRVPYSIGQHNSNKIWFAFTYDDASYSDFHYGSIQANASFFVGFTYDSNDSISLYQDGDFLYGYSSGKSLGSYANDLYLMYNSVDYYSPGVVDEPMVFNRALSASEIKAIYENGRTGIGLAKGKDNYLGFLVPGVGVSYDVSSWTAGNTYHVVGSWDKENAYLYINGSLVASGTRDTSAVIASVDDSIYVGNILGTVTADGYVHTRVYDVVLPATKSTASTQGLPQWMSVEGLYNSGSPIDAPVTEHVLFKYPST